MVYSSVALDFYDVQASLALLFSFLCETDVDCEVRCLLLAEIGGFGCLWAYDWTTIGFAISSQSEGFSKSSTLIAAGWPWILFILFLIYIDF